MFYLLPLTHSFKFTASLFCFSFCKTFFEFIYMIKPSHYLFSPYYMMSFSSAFLVAKSEQKAEEIEDLHYEVRIAFWLRDPLDAHLPRGPLTRLLRIVPTLLFR